MISATSRDRFGAVSQDELVELFVRWRQGRDHRAREQLVVIFLPLARRLARR
jgi:hypothetical protein